MLTHIVKFIDLKHVPNFRGSSSTGRRGGRGATKSQTAVPNLQSVVDKGVTPGKRGRKPSRGRPPARGGRKGTTQHMVSLLSQQSILQVC